MRKVVIVTCLLCMSVVLLNAQQADSLPRGFVLKGIVIDGESSEALPGAVVALIDTKLGSNTNLNGKYCIKNIPQGFYTLTARMMGYETFVIANITVSNDSLINIKLWPQWFKDPDEKEKKPKKQVDKKIIYHEHCEVGDFVRPGLIKGFVTDSVTGSPLHSAVVSISGDNRYTDQDGFYRFTNKPVGSYSIKVERYGYKPIIINNVKVKRSQLIVFDFKMIKL